jgi:hypothetical protein
LAEATPDRSELVDLVARLFPGPEPRAVEAGDACTLDGDPRLHRVAAVRRDSAVVYLAALPSATYRRVPLEHVIPLDEQTA